MQYICLRDCFVNDRLHSKGEVYELPDDFPKSEKNFKLLSGAPESTTDPTEGSLACQVCGRGCKGEFGLQSHMRTHK